MGVRGGTGKAGLHHLGCVLSAIMLTMHHGFKASVHVLTAHFLPTTPSALLMHASNYFTVTTVTATIVDVIACHADDAGCHHA